MEGIKIHNLIADSSLKGMRICKFPVRTEGSIVIDDRLEEEGRLRLYEYVSGNLYINDGMSKMNNIVLVAELEIEKDDKGKLMVRKLFHEYGYEGLVSVMVDQGLAFADFYGLGIEFPDLEKETVYRTETSEGCKLAAGQAC